MTSTARGCLQIVSAKKLRVPVPKLKPNKAKAISTKLLELNLKNKLEETGKKKSETKTYRDKKKNWKQIHQNRKKLNDTKRNRNKQEKTGRNGKKKGDTGRNRNK